MCMRFCCYVWPIIITYNFKLRCNRCGSPRRVSPGHSWQRTGMSGFPTSGHSDSVLADTSAERSASKRYEPVRDAMPDGRPANRCFERFQQQNRANDKKINNVRPSTRAPIVDDWNEKIKTDNKQPRHDLAQRRHLTKKTERNKVFCF